MTGRELSWRKSSYSAANGDCVEIGWPESTEVAVRDSKLVASPILAFSSARWQAFLGQVSRDRSTSS